MGHALARPRRPSQRARAKARMYQKAHQSAVRANAKHELAAVLREIGFLALDRLHQVIESGKADAAYVAALRLTLQAAGLLGKRQRQYRPPLRSGK